MVRNIFLISIVPFEVFPKAICKYTIKFGRSAKGLDIVVYFN